METAGASVVLCQVPGRVRSVAQFARTHLAVLSAHERRLVERFLDCLPGAERIPPELRVPRAVDAGSDANGLPATPCGRRSAYYAGPPVVQLKGCLSRPGDQGFPSLSFDPSVGHMVRTEIPYGALTPDQVMREILAWCFQSQHGVEIGIRPLGVYEYVGGSERANRYCLLSAVAARTRVEALWDYPHATLAAVASAYLLERTGRMGCFSNEEVSLSVPRPADYLGMKRRLLLGFQKNLGFRGVLNSNSGNEMLWEDAEGWHLAFCDFDDFRLLPPVSPPVADGILDAYLAECCCEHLAGSPLIDTFVLLPEDVSREEARQTFHQIYTAASRSWRDYRRELQELCRTAFSEEERFAPALARFERLPIYLDFLMEKIPNSLNWNRWQRSIYVPHVTPAVPEAAREQAEIAMLGVIGQVLTSPCRLAQWLSDPATYTEDAMLPDADRLVLQTVDTECLQRLALQCNKHLSELGTIRRSYSFRQ